MKKSIILFLILALMLTFVAGCSNEGIKEDLQNIKDKAGDVVKNITDKDSKKAPELNQEYFADIVQKYLEKAYNIQAPENYDGLAGFEYFHPTYRQMSIDTGEVDTSIKNVKEEGLRLSFNDDMEVLAYAMGEDKLVAIIIVVWSCYTECKGKEPFDGNYLKAFYFTETEKGSNDWRIFKIEDVDLELEDEISETNMLEGK